MNLKRWLYEHEPSTLSGEDHVHYASLRSRRTAWSLCLKGEDMNFRKVGLWLFGGVVLFVAGYATLILFLTWPITSWTVSGSGVFGDSFGILTALFSGLAFSGLIVTILMQHEELSLQRLEIRENRVEFKKSAEAQDRNAKLVALSTLLNEYKEQISNLNRKYNGTDWRTMSSKRKTISVEISEIVTLKDRVLEEIESILIQSGIDLQGSSVDET